MHNVGVYPILCKSYCFLPFNVMSFEEELEAIEREEWLAKFDDKQLLKQLKLLQLQKKEIDMQITEKKMVLEKYYLEGIIMSTFSIDGVKVTRKRKPEKWEYSNTTNQFRKDMINAIEDKEQQEREEGIATKLETGFTWSIR